MVRRFIHDNSVVRAVNGDELLGLLRSHKATLARRFGITEIALYGSFARDEGTEASDIDVLVAFDAPPDLERYFGVQSYLESLLGRRVDLSTSSELRVEIRPFVEQEAIDV